MLCKVVTFLSKTSAYLACIRDMYNERRTQDLHRHSILCIWSRSTLLVGVNQIPCLLFEQLFIYTNIWFKRNILLSSILSLSYYLLCYFVKYAHVFTKKFIVLIDKLVQIVISYHWGFFFNWIQSYCQLNDGIDIRESDLWSDHGKNYTICLYISGLNIWYLGMIVW